jgi:hypothetical protein
MQIAPMLLHRSMTGRMRSSGLGIDSAVDGFDAGVPATPL